MKFVPNAKLLPQPPISAEAHAVLIKYAETLDQSVAFGTHVLDWYQEGATQEIPANNDAGAPVLLLLRHALEILDGVATMLRNDVVEPAKLLARSLFEADLAIQYILQSDFERRGMAFMTCHVLQRRSEWNILVAETHERKQLLESMAKDKHLAGLSLPEEPKALEQVQRLADLLKRTGYLEALKEVERTRAKGKGRRIPKWYSLYDGPRDVRGLAEHLGRVGEYDFSYRRYSGFAHGVDVLAGKLVKDDSGQGSAIIQLRNPEAAYEIWQYCIVLAIDLYRRVIQRFAPKKIPEFTYWYSTEIQPSMCSQQKITVS